MKYWPILAGFLATMFFAFATFLVVSSWPKKTVQGICVAYDVNTVGTMIDQPVMVNGVVTCQVGTFVSIQPQR